jgi:hypothetical protein
VRTAKEVRYGNQKQKENLVNNKKKLRDMLGIESRKQQGRKSHLRKKALAASWCSNKDQNKMKGMEVLVRKPKV